MFYNRMLLMSNLHFAKLSEVRIKRILFHNSKKVRERFVPLHAVINHFKSDPEFLNVHTKYTLIKSNYIEPKPKNWTLVQRFGVLEEEKYLDVEKQLNRIRRLWTEGSIGKFECYKLSHFNE